MEKLQQITTKMESRIKQIKDTVTVIQQESAEIYQFLEEIVTKNVAVTMLEKEKTPKKSSELCPQRQLKFS